MRTKGLKILCPDLNGKLWNAAYPCGQDPLLATYRVMGATFTHTRWIDPSFWRRVAHYAETKIGYKVPQTERKRPMDTGLAGMEGRA
jgi:hypothetical protein